MKVFFLKMWHIINTATLKTLISIHVANDVSFCPSSQTQYIFFYHIIPFFCILFYFYFPLHSLTPSPPPLFFGSLWLSDAAAESKAEEATPADGAAEATESKDD